jgi:RHS Repeat
MSQIFQSATTCSSRYSAALRRKHFVFLVGFLSFAVLSFGRNSAAQVIDPVTAAAAPIAGAGHHYIGNGAEIVNPADGSVSFRLPIKPPSGRMLSLTFGISYNSAAPFYISGNGESPYFNWQTATVFTAPPFENYGWSYDLPKYVAQGYVQNVQATPNGTNYCWSTQNYAFTGLDGVDKTLYLSDNWADPSNPIATYCGNPSNYAGGGDDGLQTSFGPIPNGSGAATQPPLTVTDKSGTVYQFASVYPYSGTNPANGGPALFGMLAQSITDKNGNTITLQGVSGGGLPLPAGKYIDTVGRNPAISWSGIGSTSGDQLYVSGLGSNIVVKWTTTNVTLPTVSQPPIYHSQLYGSECAFNSTSGNTLASIPVVSEIDIPGTPGQAYKFDYTLDPSGQLSKITFPDGGYVRYVWGSNPQSQFTYQTWTPQANDTEFCYALVDAPAITDRYVSRNGTTEILHQHFSYKTVPVTSTSAPPYWSSKTTTVTDTDSISGQTTTTLYTYVPTVTIVGPNSTSWRTLQTPVEEQVTYEDGSGTIKKVNNKTWYNRFIMTGDQTILDSDKAHGTTTLYCPDLSDRILATYEYDFPATAGAATKFPACSTVTLASGLDPTAIGQLLRQTATVYHKFSPTYIFDEPDSVTVTDASGSMLKQRTYIYDGQTVFSSGVSTGWAAPSGARGNATSVTDWLSTGASPVTTYTYWDTGQVRSMTDPCGNGNCPDMSGTNHTTTYSYSDAYASGAGAPPSGVQTNAYLTQATYPNTGVAHVERFTWGYNDGLVHSRTDQNSQTTSYSYTDPLLRLTDVYEPPSAQNGNTEPHTQYAYSDGAGATMKKVDPDGVTHLNTLDGFGSVISSELTTDPNGPDTVTTVYDGEGRVHSVSNAYRSTEGPLTSYIYDPLGRKTQLTNPDSSTQQWQFSGPKVTFKDENQNQWQRTNDALSRLAQVVEPNGANTYYTYNLRNDLTCAAQDGGTGGAFSSCQAAPSSWRARSFAYDSLSRLIAANNPETGTICYGTSGGLLPTLANCSSGYDSSGNLEYKTDSRGVVAGYRYDALNRLLSKTYSSDENKSVSSCFQYDVSSVTNGIGRLGIEWTQSASAGVCPGTLPTSGIWSRRSILTYDAMGRITSEQQCTPYNCASGSPYAPTYTYDLAGNPIVSTNGITSTPVVGTLSLTNAFNLAGWLQGVTSNWSDTTHPTSLFSAQAGTSTLPCSSSQTSSFAPFGGLMNATYGGGSLTLNRGYDSRLRTNCENDTGSLLKNSTNATATVTITGEEQSK